jgi:hypothetical protein
MTDQVQRLIDNPNMVMTSCHSLVFCRPHNSIGVGLSRFSDIRCRAERDVLALVLGTTQVPGQDGR